MDALSPSLGPLKKNKFNFSFIPTKALLVPKNTLADNAVNRKCNSASCLSEKKQNKRQRNNIPKFVKKTRKKNKH